MLIEGRGTVAPAHEIVSLSESDVTFVSDAAAARNRYRNYSRRSDAWGRGVVSDPVFVGLLGEHATAIYLNRRAHCRLSIDTELRKQGDRGVDLATDGIGLQIKTRQPKTKTNLFRRVDSRKRLQALRGEMYVFCRREHDREIWLLGWIEASAMRRVASHVKSYAGDWWNLDVDDSYLLPMSRLVEEIVLRRSL